jgi:glycosyltransferase involved in cell wall biosynthesis
MYATNGPGARSNMIRVLHILWTANFGGIERLVLDLSSVQKSDTETEAAILFGKERGEGEFLNEFRNAGLKCHFLKLNSGYDLSFWKYLEAIRIFKQYDILQFNSFNPFLALCAVISGKKILYAEHGFFGFGKRKTWADRAKTLLNRRFLNSYVDCVSFNSEFTGRNALERYGLAGVRKSVVYNGIALRDKRYPSNEAEGPLFNNLKEKFVVGTSSRFVESKRMDHLIHAFSTFQKGKETVLLLVGDGPLRDMLEKMSKENGIHDKTIFTGYKSNVMDYQNLMDVCAFPFRNESFGLVAAETLSLGKPTIVFTDGGGIVEVAGGYSKSDVVEDVKGLIKRLEYYHSNRNEIHDRAEERINYAMKFDIMRTAREYNAVYEELAGDKRNK